MATNDFNATVPEIWSNYAQKLLENTLVGKQVANYRTEANLVKGDTVHIPRLTKSIAEDYVAGQDNNIQNISSSKESLVINKEKIVYNTLEDADKKQSSVNLEQEMIGNMAQELAQDVDTTFLSEIDNAKYSFDDAGSAYDLTTDDVQEVVSYTAADLRSKKVGREKPWIMIATPTTVAAIENKMVSSGFNRADSTLTNGYVGDFLGYRIYESTNLPVEVDLGLATNPTDGDKVSINGVEFTFVDTIGTAEGNVHIGTTADDTAQNLVAAINAGAGEGTDYVEVSVADRRSLTRERIVATDGTDLVTIKAAGKMTLSATLTASGDGFGDQVSLHYFGQTGGIDMAMQMAPQFEKMRMEKRQAFLYKLHDLYGTKVFSDGAERFGKLRIKA